MAFTMLKQSGHLRMQSISSPDQLQMIGFIELERLYSHGPYFQERAITALPGMLLILEKTSPRSLIATMNSPGCAIILPMKDQTDAIFNGQSWRVTQLGIARGQVPIDLYDPTPDVFAIIRFTSSMQNRDWETTEGRLRLQAASADDIFRLQRIVRKILASSCAMPRQQFSAEAEIIKQELVDALDQTLISQDVRQGNCRSFEKHRQLVSRLDEFVRSRPDATFSGEILAKELSTSIRTLQLAVREIQGTSLHNHLRARKLWSLRAQLVKGLPSGTVSSAASANGFFHMGELARLYKATFGEVPSETLLRSRRS